MKKRKSILNWIITVITFTAVAIMAIKTDFSQFRPAMSDLNYLWLCLALVIVIMSWLSDALIIKNILPGITGKKVSILKSIKYSIVGLYYMALTPFGSAGQPMQMVYMANDGIPIGKTTAAASIKFFTDKIAVCFIFNVFLIISGDAFYKSNNGIFWFSIIAFAMNLLILMGVFLLIRKPAFAGRVFKGSIRFLAKLKIVKNPQKTETKIDAAIKDYSLAAQFILGNKTQTFILSLLSILRRMLLIAVPYLLYRAFGFSMYGMIEIMALNVFMSLAITLMPTPGSSLAAEGGFSAIYISIFGVAIIPAVVIWRLLTYYLVIIVGSTMIIGNKILKMVYRPSAETPKLVFQRRDETQLQEDHLRSDILKQLT